MKRSFKKIFPITLALSLMIGGMSFPAVGGAEGIQDGVHKKVSWDSKKGIPDFVIGKLSDKKVASKSQAVRFLEENKSLFKIGAGEFRVKSESTDELGMTHFRAEMTVDGIPVYGTDLYVHVDANGDVYAVNGQAEPRLQNKKWNQKVKLTGNEALAKAEEYLDLPSSMEYTAKDSSLYLYKNDKKWQPAYLVELAFLEPHAARQFTFVSAEDGSILESYDALADATSTGTGVTLDGTTVQLNTFESGGTYYLQDTTKPMSGVIETYTANNRTRLPGSIVSDSNNVFDSSVQAAAVDAHVNAGITYDYYYETFNRNSYDNNGASLISTVHYDRYYNNAFWNGTQMVYGDGDGSTFSPLSGALDVIAHELTHAVTEETANLVYQNQPGALNESMSDVFGMIVEAYNGDTDWLMGEDVYTPGVEGDALRSLSNPELYDQPAHMDHYYVTSDDNGGVHTNSGIPNKAFYNIATSIGLDASAEIYYRALTTYLTSQSDFTDARNGLLQAATDLYGEGSVEYNAVNNGFLAVGIDGSSSGGNETPDSDTFEPNNSFNEAYGPLVSGTTYGSYISTSTDSDFYMFEAEIGQSISVELGNLPGDYDLYLYDSNRSLVGASENAWSRNELISHSAGQTGTYYVEVVGWNGAMSTTTPYHLTVTIETNTKGSKGNRKSN
ncbi:M4 family metallopeptidase [Bacillaceae bacterium S4-13-56]